MLVYRLSRAAYRKQLSGYGASLNGQRWNSKGTEVLYVAQSRALACSEVVVHLPLSILPDDYYMLEIELPDNAILKSVSEKELPLGWDSLPHQPQSQRIGDSFVQEGEALGLRVPSVVIPGDFNYMLNPYHPEFSQVKIVGAKPFPFDSRLFNR
ncbi:MAG: RES family NAD+ phosphorylase [Bacteroidota bacterium]